MDVERLYAESHEALYRYLTRYTGDADLAADLVQDSFLRLLERRPQVASARQWLFRVATNLANDSARTRRRRRLLLLASGARVPHADPPAPPDEQVELTDRAARMQRALLHLSEKERTALLMREEGFKHHEIAATIGTETSTVGTLMARALRKLARSMDPDREEP